MTLRAQDATERNYTGVIIPTIVHSLWNVNDKRVSKAGLSTGVIHNLWGTDVVAEPREV